MKKQDIYYWNFSNEGNVWYNFEESIEECLAQAQKENEAGHKIVFVGKLDPYKPDVDEDMLIENLEESAWDNVGECAEGWFDGVSRDQKVELRLLMREALEVWMENNNLKPHFGNFEWTRKYDLATGKEVE